MKRTGQVAAFKYQDTITPTWFFKFTDYSYLESGARYYLYSIMGEMDGQLYAMAMPGTDVVYKQAAIPVWPDEGGGIPLGYNRENIFMLTRDFHTVGDHYLYHLTTGTALDIFFAGSPDGGIGRGRRNLTGDEGFYIDTNPNSNYAATIYPCVNNRFSCELGQSPGDCFSSPDNLHVPDPPVM